MLLYQELNSKVSHFMNFVDIYNVTCNTLAQEISTVCTGNIAKIYWLNAAPLRVRFYQIMSVQIMEETLCSDPARGPSSEAGPVTSKWSRRQEIINVLFHSVSCQYNSPTRIKMPDPLISLTSLLLHVFYILYLLAVVTFILTLKNIW